VARQDLPPGPSLSVEQTRGHHPWVTSTSRATRSAPSRSTRRMMQRTGAAFQAEVSLNEQITDPKSHTPVSERLSNPGVPRHLLSPMVDPGSFWVGVDLVRPIYAKTPTELATAP